MAKGKLPTRYRAHQSESTDVEEYFLDRAARAAAAANRAVSARVEETFGVEETATLEEAPKDINLLQKKGMPLPSPAAPPVELVSSILEETARAEETPPVSSRVAVSSRMEEIENESSRAQAGLWVSTSRNTYPGKRVFPIRRAQDSMTGGEGKVYDLLWRQIKNSGLFRVLSTDKDVHVIQAGYDTLAKLCGLSERSIRNLIPKLEEKYALAVRTGVRLERGQKTQACIYEIYSYGTILAKQKQAGWSYAIKNGPAVELVKRLSECSRVEETARVEKIKSVSARVEDTESARVEGTVSSRVAVTDALRVEESATPSYRDNPFRQSTTTDVCRLLQTKLPTFDSAAVEQLWSECREQVPDVTPEEVQHLFVAKLPLSQARGIENPIGFLVRAVARSCTPAAIGALRQGREEPPAVELSFDQGELQELLEDANTTPELREFIHRKLGAGKG
jgi:hypothetical protein